MTSLIFLDVDGVLNSRGSRESGDHKPQPQLLSHLRHVIDATAVSRTAQRIFASNPTVAAIGPTHKLTDYDRIRSLLS